MQDEAEGQNIGSGFECTANFANPVIESYFPEKFYRNIPSMVMPLLPEISRERGVEALKAEATGLRCNLYGR